MTELREFVDQTAHAVDPEINIHDLRIVPGNTHTNVIFDVAVPPKYLARGSKSGRDLLNTLRDAVRSRWPDHFCVIQLEQQYAELEHNS